MWFWSLEMVVFAAVLNGFLLTITLSALLTFLCVAWMLLDLENYLSPDTDVERLLRVG
jgi:hypothetical protein